MTSTESQPTCVLIVDDDTAFLDALAEYLREHGYEAIMACCGRDALSMTVDYLPNVAIVDVHLPDTDGLELACELQRRHAGLPVVVISADGSTRIQERCQELQVFRFMLKPIAPPAVLTAIREALDTTTTRR